MASTMTAKVGSLVSLTLNLNPAYGTNTVTVANPAQFPLTFGTAAGQFQYLTIISTTATAAPVTFDLTSNLSTASGVAYSNATGGYATVCGLIVINDSTTDGNNLRIDGTAANAFAAMYDFATTPVAADYPRLIVPAGVTINSVAYSTVAMFGGYNTTAWTVDSTHKVLSFNPLANTIAFRALIFGR